MINSTSSSEKFTAYGFFAVTFMVFVMVVIGGLTRLTGSGLSMVEWKPLTGFLPPLNEADWALLFEKYRQFPEFLKVNYDMDLEGFKQIFWLEFIHRVWGRLIGVALLIPTVSVVFNSSLRRRYWFPTLLLWVLGAAQGALGWYMVKSGLLSDPHVSPYRLTAHLLMAFLILGVSLQTGLNLKSGKKFGINRYRKRTSLMIGLVVLTASFGGLVAGLKAGLIYNTFPLMDESWLPEAMWFLDPLWKNLTENAGTVQFFHRILAMVTFGVVSIISYQLLKKHFPDVRRSSLLVLLVVSAQFLLGITTLLMQVPVSLGVLHQAVALVLFMSLILLRHRIKLSRL